MILKEYGHVLGNEYWAVWEGNSYREEKGSLNYHKKLEDIAERLELPEKAKLKEIAAMLEDGANLGIEVTIHKQAWMHLVWWLLNMRALPLEGTFIADPDGYFPKSAILLYPDEAGGDPSNCCYP